jgi:hypothetical protein
MKQVINEIKEQQNKMLLLLEEYRHAKRFELLQSKFDTFYILKDGYLLDNTGRIIHHKPQFIKNFLFIRRSIAAGQVLDIDGRIKEVFRHHSHGKK